MKIRHPWLIRTASFLASLTVRALIGTLRFRYQSFGPNLEPHRVVGHYIYAFWHENLLLPAYHYGLPNCHVLISQHADGEFITQVAQRLGLSVVRGSSTRGGVQALRQCMRAAENGHLVVTPDGPRGPRRQVHDGLIYLAARTGLPIVPAGVGYCRPWRANSWDRLAIPRPGSRARCVTGTPIAVPADVEREQLASYRQRVQTALLDVGAIAERWAETGVWPAELEQRAAA